MTVDRKQLPHPEDYYLDCGLRLEGRGKWRTTCCTFCECHTMRVNVASGAYECTDCGASGGDVLTHHMELTGADEVQAAMALGAWRYDFDASHTKLEVRHGI